jgi:SH3-like domain-containing protein
MDRVVILRVGLAFLLVVFVASLVPFSISAQDGRDRRPLGESGLPLPRFVSISKSEANVRRGPGGDYPLLWQYQKRGLPLEIVAEYGQWRQIRDHEGGEGWIHSRLLRGKRTIVVREAANALQLRRAPRAGAGTVALVQSGTIGALQECQANWCEVELGGYTGWLPRDMLWGIYNFEQFD